MSIAPGWRGWVVCVWLEKQAADSCVFMRSGWESQLWSADLHHKQERLCKFDLPSINPLWIFPITGRIIGKPHPHIPALLCSDEPYKDWLWPSHKEHQAAFIIVNEHVMFRWCFLTTWLGSELNSSCEKQKTNSTMINSFDEHISATLKSSEDKRPVIQQIVISWLSE